jgi:hypothetical protein
MNVFKILKYNLYKILLKILPKTTLKYLGQLKILKPIRDFLFGRDNQSFFRDYINWNEEKFYFYASPQVLYKAKKRGIESSLLRAIIKIIDNNSNIIDIGANYGFLTIVLAKYVLERNGKIFSFEYDKNIFDFLKKSIDKNNLTNVELFNFFMGEENFNNIKTVNSLLSKSDVSIDLIKIDTDGSDLECLKGCSEIILKYHPIIVIESNDNLEFIVNYVKKYGYNYYYNQYLVEYQEKNLNNEEVPNLIASIKKINFRD